MLAIPEHLPPLAPGLAAGLRHALDADWARVVVGATSIAFGIHYGFEAA